MEEQRLDKWLWAARLCKTRTLASAAIQGGKITLNEVKAKPAKLVRVGDRIEIRRPPYRYLLEISGLSARRLSADKALSLYREDEHARRQRLELAELIKLNARAESRHGGKPTKKERRERERVKRGLRSLD